MISICQVVSICSVYLQGARCILVQTKEISVQPADITRIFGSDGSVPSAVKGTYMYVDLYTEF